MTVKRQVLAIVVVALLATSAHGQNVRSFCEYGIGSTSQIGAGGAVWYQTWGEGAWGWYDCEASPNVGFLDENVTSVLVTHSVGTPPSIDSDWILRLAFGGQLTLTAWDDDAPSEIAGQIVGDVDCVFVADLSAERAVVDEQAGTIAIVFGAELHDDVDAWITVVKTTGKFSSIHAEGPWRWHAVGTVTIALVPTMDLQANILAALLNPDLVLSAEQEVVLAGSYYRGSPHK